MRHLLLLSALILLVSGCSYIDAVKRAKESDKIKGTNAYYDKKCLIADECAEISGSVHIEHIFGHEAFGMVVVYEDENESRVIDATLLKFSDNEHRAKDISYYFFDLPVGDYTLYAVRDDNHNETLDMEQLVTLSEHSFSIKADNLLPYQNTILLDDMVIADDQNGEPFLYPLDDIIAKTMLKSSKINGTFQKNISLDDAVFDHKTAQLGLYYPDAFKKSVQLLYRLAPEYKEGTIPLIFVHGMGGSPRDFKKLVSKIDRDRYTPYVTYYPSGDDFARLSKMFNDWMLTNKIFTKGPKVIIAHSFGGTIIRDSLNLEHLDDEILFISIATPFGGDAKASKGVKNAPYVLPAWRSIADNGNFIRKLYRESLTPNEHFELIFTYKNGGDGESSDGQVELSKQLRMQAQQEADHIRGYNESHTKILNNDEAIGYINKMLETFSETHQP